MNPEWGYNETNGPATWAQKFPEAGGARQSPVDIATALVSTDQRLQESPLLWHYSQGICQKIVNPGYGWRVDVNGKDTELKGGPLSGKYKLEQFHCHWGKTSNQGSEHTVDGKAYAGELHLVHWNCEKYSSFAEAAKNPDGLAVLGIFLQVGNENKEISKVASLIFNIIHKNQTSTINEQINPAQFLPNTKQYWTYLGSLTTPPCSESVIWIVFKEPINVSEAQLAAFRSMKNICKDANAEDEGCQVVNNYRPPLPLGNRVLRECGSV